MGEEEEVDQEKGNVDSQEPEGGDSDEEETPGPNRIGGVNFPTLELTLEEARRQYDDEERRRESVEGKIGIVVTADALIVSLGAALSQTISLIPLIAALSPALISAGLGLYTIRSQKYKRPGKDILDFHDYAEFDSVKSQQEKLLLDYERTADDNRVKNDTKYTAFNECGFLTVISLVLTLLALVVSNTSIFDCICSFRLF